MFTPYNAKTVTVKMQRIDLCDIMMALTAVSNSLDSETDKKKWNELHNKMEAILKDFDEKHREELTGA